MEIERPQPGRFVVAYNRRGVYSLMMNATIPDTTESDTSPGKPDTSPGKPETSPAKPAESDSAPAQLEPAILTDGSDLVSEPLTPSAETTAPSNINNPSPGASAESPEAPEPGEVKSDRPWTCPRCPDKHYEYRSFLARHIRRAHKDDADTMLAALPPSEAPKGRPRGIPNKQRPNFEDITAAVADTAAVDYKFMAEMLFNMSTGTLTGMFGPEWQPREDSPGSNTSKEKDNTVECIRIYLETKKVKDIPPGLMLTFVCVAYAGPRLKAPATSQKIKYGWHWLKSKFSRKNKLRVI